MRNAEKVFVALDTPALDVALDWAGRLKGVVGGLKLGLEFFGAQGPEGVRRVSETGMPVFLDLKFHDIPNTVAQAVTSVTPLAPVLATIHAGGGRAMMEAAVAAARETADKAGVARPKILAVTVLTSLDGDDLAAAGVSGGVEEQVVRLARLAQQAGVDGVVCSPREIVPIRRACGRSLLLVVPGLRPAGAAPGDQKRVMTPGEAVSSGADYLVIGRPITQAVDPVDAARAIAASLDAVTAG
ncbi:MAG: orotidine-5'-phosphate decarboxylase [Alphaproteobacteria bacterium]|nr:orotidine-5'-phosphate decarboxylase [Alphaproteobacteria bacterium]